jgi:hypothetical protein
MVTTSGTVCGVPYCVVVSDEYLLLQRPDVGVENVEPFDVEADLGHVDVAGGNVLVAAL